MELRHFHKMRNEIRPRRRVQSVTQTNELASSSLSLVKKEKREEKQEIYTGSTMNINHTSPTTNKLTLPQGLKRRKQQSTSGCQPTSFVLFFSLVLLINLCPPFELDMDDQSNARYLGQHPSGVDLLSMRDNNRWPQETSTTKSYYLNQIQSCLKFAKLMFSNPMRLGKRTMRYTQAEAKILGKMAKVWYIKKKVKKLGKKLKKHTIAVPVFTAIPIYEHSYYPQPHVMQVSHGPMHHHAAASSYAPTVTHLAAVASSPPVTSTSPTSSSGQQMATSASHNHPVSTGYRAAPASQHGSMYHHHHHHAGGTAAAQQIINAYAPSPPLFVDEAGGLYGHYGNAYGRYDGGYQYW